jgi:WD repeat-containing protein 76
MRTASVPVTPCAGGPRLTCAAQVYTSSYDCTVRHLSFTTGVSREVFHTGEGDLASGIELAPTGHEMWIANGRGWLTHADLRQPVHSAVSFQLAEDKVGCVSVNPTEPHLLLTASNDRTVRYGLPQCVAVHG